MVNLNNTPSAGPLTADEVSMYWPPRRAYVPLGCDQQGRQPEAAHAASEIDDALTQHGRSVTRYQDMALELAAWVIALLLIIAIVHAVLAMY